MKLLNSYQKGVIKLTKYYLDQEGLEKLVNYIHTALDNKMDKGSVPELPTDIIKREDLNEYAKISALNNYATKDSIEGFLTDADLNTYALLTDLNNYAEKRELEELEGKVTGAYHFRGSVNDLSSLQAIENPQVGDVYNLKDTGMNAGWTGSEWDEFGSVVDLTDYAKTEDIQSIARTELNRILYNGTSAIVTDFEGLQSMVSNEEEEVTVTLNKNLALTSTLVVPEGKTVTIDMGGKQITASGNVAPVWSSGGNIVLKNGSVSADTAAVVVRDGGSVVIENADITSNKNNAISAKEGTVTINGGNISSQEAGVAGFKDSTIILNDGVLTGIDNCPLMGNGSAAGSANDGTNMNIIMNGGKLVAHIKSAGYAACGVYVPNSGSFTMNGGEIISDGAGLVMRGGKVTLNGGKITANGAAGATGKVGDSRVVVGSYAVVYDANSKYPAKDTLELVIGKDMVLEGTDGDLQILLEKETDTANITDNRA